MVGFIVFPRFLLSCFRLTGVGGRSRGLPPLAVLFFFVERTCISAYYDFNKLFTVGKKYHQSREGFLISCLPKKVIPLVPESTLGSQLLPIEWEDTEKAG